MPDVYHFSVPVTAFLAVSSKAAGFFAINIGQWTFACMTDFLLPLLGFVATFTILFGMAACAQQNFKRCLGYRVAHAVISRCRNGIMHLAGDSDRAVWAIYFYLFMCLLASFIIFGVMSLMTLEKDSDYEFQNFEGLLKNIHGWHYVFWLVFHH